LFRQEELLCSSIFSELQLPAAKIFAAGRL
jgi:hypothetical protein